MRERIFLGNCILPLSLGELDERVGKWENGVSRRREKTTPSGSVSDKIHGLRRGKMCQVKRGYCSFVYPCPSNQCWSTRRKTLQGVVFPPVRHNLPLLSKISHMPDLSSLKMGKPLFFCLNAKISRNFLQSFGKSFIQYLLLNWVVLRIMLHIYNGAYNIDVFKKNKKTRNKKMLDRIFITGSIPVGLIRLFLTNINIWHINPVFRKAR